jgi:hypothetical protein
LSKVAPKKRRLVPREISRVAAIILGQFTGDVSRV